MAVKQALFITKQVYEQVPAFHAYVDNRGRVIHETKVKTETPTRVGFRHIVDNFIFGVNVTLYAARQALTVHTPPVGIVLVLLDGCHLFGGQVRVILVRRMYRNVSVTYELRFAPELTYGVVVDDNLFTGTDIKLPKDFTRYALRLIYEEDITCRTVHLAGVVTRKELYYRAVRVFVCTFCLVELVLVPIPLGCNHGFKVTEHTALDHWERSRYARNNERLGVVQCKYVQHL
ncbi:hypothetical protein BU730P1_00050 [Bacteroides phage BU730P1]|nr:hypothetical protein BU730P1_00050 [Bacteroides phage BU730P1]